MTLKAVLDACVLYPFSIRDTLLRLAELELYDIVWSERILQEMARNLAANQVMPQEKADRLVTLMRNAFPEAEVQATTVAQLDPVMTNHAGDRHVLATAVAAHAEVIVTSNIRHFPAEACAHLGVEAVRPDGFLLVLHAKAPQQVHRSLADQAGDLQKPPMTLDLLLDIIAKEAPSFIAAVRAHELTANPTPLRRRGA